MLSFIIISRFLPLHATAIDSFNNPTGWSTFVDASATASTGTATGQTQNALKLTYDLTGGSFVGITRDVTGMDFTGGGANSLRFYYRATGVSNTMEVKFTDTDSTDTSKSDKLDYKFIFTPDGAWREMIVPFSDFLTFAEGNNSFNTRSVARLGIAVTKDNGNAGSGSVSVDGFQLYFQNSFASAIDTFETADLKNSRSLTVVFFAGGTTGAGSAVYVTTQSASGARGLELNYSVTGAGFAGIEENLGGLVAPIGTESLRFWVKGGAGFEPLSIEIVDKNTTVARSLSSYGTITASFQKFSIPLADFAGLDLKSLQKVKFVFKDNSGTGKIYIDDVAITGSGSGAASQTIQDVETFSLDKPLTTFTPYVDTLATLNFDFVKDLTVPGAADDNRAGRLDYTFTASVSTPYALVERELRPNLLAEPVLKFRFKGDGGNNNLEVKLTDVDGTVYVRKFVSVTNTGGEWKTAAVPVEEFGFTTLGGDAVLDLKRIKKIDFAVVRGEIKAGTITFDEMESGLRPTFEKTDLGGVLQKVTTPNNPFSPNGDGVQDTAKFLYTLGQTARVTLRLFDLRGVPLKTFDGGEQLAGDHILEWDGVDKDGRRVANGVYFFRLEADGVGGGHDEFKEIIGVVR